MRANNKANNGQKVTVDDIVQKTDAMYATMKPVKPGIDIRCINKQVEIQKTYDRSKNENYGCRAAKK